MTRWYEERSTRELYEIAYRDAREMHRFGCSPAAWDGIANSYPPQMREQIRRIWSDLREWKPGYRHILDARQWYITHFAQSPTNAFGSTAVAYRGKVYKVCVSYKDGILKTWTEVLPR